MACLNALPNELVNQIVVKIEQSGSLREKTNNLYSLSLVNRRLYELATPALYCNVCCGVTYSRVDILLRTLLARPDLGLHVRVAELHWDGLDGPETDGSKTAGSETAGSRHSAGLNPLEIDRCMRAAVEAGISQPDLLVALRSGKDDAQVALLLYQLPRLRCLHLFPPLSWPFVHQAFVPSIPPNSDFSRLPAALRSVHKVRITHDPRREGDHIADTLQCFFLPSVRIVTADLPMGECWIPQDWDPEEMWGKSPVWELNLTGSVMEINELELFLRMPKELHFLSYEHRRRNDNDPCLSPAELSTALMLAQSSLRELVVNVRCYSLKPEPELDGDGANYLFTLGEFPCLRSVKVPLSLLLGIATRQPASLVDLLPAQLQWLVLGIEDGFFTASATSDLLTEVIRAAPAQFPNLVYIYLDFEGAVDFYELKPSWKLAMKLGINFRARCRKGSEVLAVSTECLLRGRVRPYRQCTTESWMGPHIL